MNPSKDTPEERSVRLSAWLDGHASDPDAVRQELRRDPDAARELEQMRQVGELLRSTQAGPGPALRESILRQAVAQRSRGPSWWRALAAGALLSAALHTALEFTPAEGSSPVSPELRIVSEVLAPAAMTSPLESMPEQLLLRRLMEIPR